MGGEHLHLSGAAPAPLWAATCPHSSGSLTTYCVLAGTTKLSRFRDTSDLPDLRMYGLVAAFQIILNFVKLGIRFRTARQLVISYVRLTSRSCLRALGIFLPSLVRGGFVQVDKGRI